MSGTLTIEQLTLPWEVRTLDGFRNWYRSIEDSRVRACYAGGNLYIEMTPQNLKTHLRLISEINRVAGNLVRELDLGVHHEHGCWLTSDGADLSSEPDGCLVLWETFESGEARIESDDEIQLVGRADLVLEVVSKTSERKDTVDLTDRYARAGIPEYWIADGRCNPPSLRILTLAGGSYTGAVPDDEGWLTSPLFGRRFRLRRITDRMGDPDYRLEVERSV